MKKKILVVDDASDFLKMIKIRLEADDYEVLAASDGKEALEMLKSSSPNAVLLDILMPGMDGLDVLKKMRRENKNLPIFMITAFSTKERFELANELKASGFIVKTDDLKKELDSINTAIKLADKYRGEKQDMARRQ